MSQIYYLPYSQDYLSHHGIKGQRWGVRRWQNEDGSLTSAGREHYGYGSVGENSNVGAKDHKTTVFSGILGKRRRKREEEVAKAKTRHDATMKARDEALRSKEVKDAEKKLDKAYKNVDEYYKLPREELQEYQKRAADIAFEQYGDGTEEGREGFRQAYMYSDADQGSENSFVQYVKSKGLDPAAESRNMYEAQKAYKAAYEEAFRKSIDSMGETVGFSFANKDAHSMSDLDIDIRNAASEAAQDAYEKIRNQKNYYNLLEM